MLCIHRISCHRVFPYSRRLTFPAHKTGGETIGLNRDNVHHGLQERGVVHVLESDSALTGGLRYAARTNVSVHDFYVCVSVYACVYVYFMCLSLSPFCRLFLSFIELSR